VLFDCGINLCHEADCFRERDDDLLVMGEVVLGEGAAFAVFEPFLADLVAADVGSATPPRARAEAGGLGFVHPHGVARPQDFFDFGVPSADELGHVPGISASPMRFLTTSNHTATQGKTVQSLHTSLGHYAPTLLMDFTFFFLINREWTSPELDRLMAIFSSASLWMMPLIFMGVCALYWGGFRVRMFVLISLVAIGLVDGVIGNLLKQKVRRLRPHQTEANVRIIDLNKPAWKGIVRPLKEKISMGSTENDGTGRSFPSNHTLNTFVIATLATLAFPRLGWMAFVPAMLVGWSRIYTGSHWPTDVAASILIAIGIGLWLALIFEWVWKKAGSKLFPSVYEKHPRVLIYASPKVAVPDTE